MTSANVPLPAEEPETVSDEADGAHQAVLALYVTGPHGGARHILCTGLITLGRSSDATIVVNDPRVSRLHAALHIGGDITPEITLNDLGSSNGTFFGDARLAPGDARPLADGQSFSIGDSVLLVRTCALRRVGTRLRTIDDVAIHYAGTSSPDEPAVVVVLTIRLPTPTRARSVEAIIGEALFSARDFFLWLDPSTLVLGIEVPAIADAPRTERDVIRLLADWGIAADVNARSYQAADLARAGDGLRVLLSGDAPVSLVKRKVLFVDPKMKDLEQTVLRVRNAPVSVLILGETGAGKDVIAAMLHELSPRADRPFIAVNCAGLPEALLESELFGYERGAFTGAASSKPGLFEAAAGGTVFLDEVGDLPLPLQAKLLRVLESHEVTRLGAVKARTIDVRFVAATNRDLARDAANGRFRQDLYYRLNGVNLTVPPLRDRPSEIEPLARLFLEGARARFEIGDVSFSSAALVALAKHTWPGNVRELKSTVERAALLAKSLLIQPSDLGLPTTDGEELASVAGSHTARTSVSSASPEPERDRIVGALEACAGNQSRAAMALGISRRTLVRRIAELGLPRPRGR